MDDYISREVTVKKIEEKLKVDGLMSLAEEVWTDNCLKIVLRTIMAVETADVQPIQFGQWENEYLDDDVWWADCTNCKNDTHSRFGRVSSYTFCPNCGAKMIKDGDTGVHDEVNKPDGNCLDCKFQYLEDSDYWCSICPGNPEDI